MKTILLLRHAKSDWGDPRLADFERPLAKRGLKDAPRMGRALAQLGFVPDVILSSTAKRAMQTAELVAEASGFGGAIRPCPEFYGGDSQDLIAALQNLPDPVDCAMLVGHNPTMEETAAELLCADEAVSIRMPTAALLCLEADIDTWRDLAPGDTTLRWFLLPKLLKALQ